MEKRNELQNPRFYLPLALCTGMIGLGNCAGSFWIEYKKQEELERRKEYVDVLKIWKPSNEGLKLQAQIYKDKADIGLTLSEICYATSGPLFNRGELSEFARCVEAPFLTEIERVPKIAERYIK